MLDILGIDSTRSVQAALLVVARLSMVGFDFHRRSRLFVDVVHVVGFLGKALKVTRQNEQAEGDPLALCTSILRPLVPSPIVRGGFVVLACISPKCTAGDHLPVGLGLSATSEPRIWHPHWSSRVLTSSTAESPRVGRMPQSRENAPESGECTPGGGWLIPCTECGGRLGFPCDLVEDVLVDNHERVRFRPFTLP
jgi:hypothetical protein